MYGKKKWRERKKKIPHHQHHGCLKESSTLVCAGFATSGFPFVDTPTAVAAAAAGVTAPAGLATLAGSALGVALTGGLAVGAALYNVTSVLSLLDCTFSSGGSFFFKYPKKHRRITYVSLACSK